MFHLFAISRLIRHIFFRIVVDNHLKVNFSCVSFILFLQPLILSKWLILRDSGFYVTAFVGVILFIFANNGKIDIYESSGLLLYFALWLVVLFHWSPGTSEFEQPESTHATRIPDAIIAMRNFPENLYDTERLENEDTPLLSVDSIQSHSSTSADICSRCLVGTYRVIDDSFNWVYSWTIPSPLQSDSKNGFAVISGVLLSLAWLAMLSYGVYEVVILICDLIPFIEPSGVGALLLASGAQVKMCLK